MTNEMTAEEARTYFIKCNENLISVAKDENRYSYERQEIEAVCSRRAFEANKLAIQALEAQPCEDCISRQAVIDFIIDNYGVGFNSLTNGIRDYLPSVTPKRPKGRWIFCYGNRGKDNVEKCSCCKSYWKEAVIYRYDTQEYLRLRLKYCPKCGAEMEGEKDANNN